VKWLFLVGLSATGAVIVLVLSSIAAGKHVLSGLELFSYQPQSLIVLLFLVAVWMGFINDIAAAIDLSEILAHKVRFREITMYGDLENNMRITSIKARLYVVYPAAIAFAFAVLTVLTSRL
jgi:hypothetical protein